MFANSVLRDMQHMHQEGPHRIMGECASVNSLRLSDAYMRQ